MKKFINLNELKLQNAQMNGIIGGMDIPVTAELKKPGTVLLRYGIIRPLYGIKPIAYPRYAIDSAVK